MNPHANTQTQSETTTYTGDLLEAGLSDAEVCPLSGTVERVVFHDRSSGKFVARVCVPDVADLVTVAGKAMILAAGMTITARGVWVLNPEHGRQFQPGEVSVGYPATMDGIRRYLEGGVIPGIGRTMAGRVVAMFGDQTLAVIEAEPEQLLKVKGMRRAWVDLVKEHMAFISSID